MPGRMVTFLARRLAAQMITRTSAATPREVVAGLGAVQGQDYAAAKWAVGLRLTDAGEASVERALAEGSVLRTHAMRGTWQLVAPEDIRWILALVAPRVIARQATRDRQLGLDETTYRRCNTVLARALRGGAHLTRVELAAALERAGVSTAGQRLAHILGRAELEAVLCGGARRGKQPTWTLLDGRAPGGAPLPRAEALAELARRYFVSRGPATVGDFTWWSGLAAADARAGLEAVKSGLACDVVNGETYWRAGEAPAPARPPRAHLLPAFDEYLIAYRGRDAQLDPRHTRRLAGGGILEPTVVLDGRVVGLWRRTLARAAVDVELELFGPVPRPGRAAIDEAAHRYGAFLGLAPRLRAP